MNRQGYGVILAIGLGVAGFFGGGYLGDALWFMANDYLLKCGDLEESMQNKCVNENRDYYAINTSSYLVGTDSVVNMIYFVRHYA